MRERIDLPTSYDKIAKPQRKLPSVSPEEFRAYKPDADLIPPMAPFGTGYRWHVTGLVHDEFGFPDGSPAATQACLDRLHAKINNNLEDIVLYEEYLMEDAEVAVLAYGGTARTAYAAVDAAREKGIKVGLFRPITMWPFPEKQVKALAEKVKHLIVAEMNFGQYVIEVERAVAGKIPVTLHAKYNSEAITPNELLAAIEKCR